MQETPSRRAILSAAVGGTVAAVLTPVLAPGAAWANAEILQREIWRLMGDRKAVDGRITLDMPELAENGAVVPVHIAVQSPMTDADHVRAIHLLAEENPWPTIASLRLTPAMGKADVRFRVRLARTQTVYAFAEMSDGRIFRAVRQVQVTIGGCS